MTTKDFIASIAMEMDKKPEDFAKFSDILEENLFDTVDSLRDIQDEQWNELKIPMRLVNEIKTKL